MTDGRSSNRNGGCQLTNDTTHDCRRLRNTRSKLSLSPRLVRQYPHITLPPLLSGPEGATPIREYRAVFAVFMRTRYRGDALKAHSKRICGIRSRHPMSHCAVVTSSPLDKLPLLFVRSFRFVSRPRSERDSRQGLANKLCVYLSAYFQRAVLSNFASVASTSDPSFDRSRRTGIDRPPSP